MLSHRTFRNAITFAVAAVAVAAAWSFHVGAQERVGQQLGQGLRRAAESEVQQARDAVAPAQRRTATPAQRSTAPHEHHARPTSECAAECADCQQICDSCAAHCLKLVADGKKEHQQTLQTCLDCAEICAAADRIVSRSGPFSDTICQACAEACARCAEACEKFPDDQHMAQCAQECRKCQQACEKMLGGDSQNVARPGQEKRQTR